MVHVPHFDQLLKVITDDAALIITTVFQLTGCDLIAPNIEQQNGLHRVDLQNADTLKFIFDHVQQQAME
tara:strand:- start:531 stop:737 length:207 start_codon:yes stop_codon:yes gene_type:complete